MSKHRTMNMRRLFLLFIAFGIAVGTTAAPRQPRKRVAVVLAGGGAKGMAHIGALKVIERAGIPVDIITGTSMGSIIGGLYAIGWNAEAMDSVVRQQDWTFLLSDNDYYYSQNLANRNKQSTYFLSKSVSIGAQTPHEIGGFIYGKNLSRLFERLTAGYTDSTDFSRLPIPFSCVATNIIDNTEHDFHSGRLAEAMRASMAIPGVFTPIRMGDKILVDGGLRNNFPADIAREMGADFIIGVTVQGEEKTADDLTSGMDILGQIVDVNCKNKYDDNLAITDVPIRVNTTGYSAASFSAAAIDTLIRRGEEEAMRHWDELVALRKQLGLPDGYAPTILQPNPEATLPLETTTQKVEERPAYDKVTGYAGARFDTEEMAALQLCGVYQSAKKPINVEATLRLGKRTKASLLGTWTMRGIAKTGVGYSFEYNDMDINEQGGEYLSTTYAHHQVSAGVMGMGIRNLILDLSVRLDYYDYRKLMVPSKHSMSDLGIDDDHYISYHAYLHYDSENTGTLPTRGAKFQARYAYFTDNFAEYQGHAGFSELSSFWRMSASIGPRVTLRPMLYGRLVFGSDIPYIRRNAIGGRWFGHYLEQQMPLMGMGYVELTDPMFVAAQLTVQTQIVKSHYVLAEASAAQHSEKLGRLLKHGPMMGYQLSYAYKTMFGPLGGSVGYSNHTDKLYFYINLGYRF